MPYLFNFNVKLCQVKMLMFYNIQTTNLIFVDKKMRYAINSYNIA